SPRSTPSSPATYAGVRVTKATHVAALDVPFDGFMLGTRSPNRLWISSPDGLAWVDPATNQAHVVDREPGVALAVDGDRLYRAAWQPHTIARYDVSGAPRLVVRHYAPTPLNIAVAPGGLWAADHNHGFLLRIDPDTLRVERKVPLGHGG